MIEQKFHSEMRRAETMRGLADPMMAEYWAGYIRGLRRAYHGEKFGTDDEHEKWLSAANSRDESRKQRGRGYKDSTREMCPDCYMVESRCGCDKKKEI